jgi:mannose-6-phosphate isomerase class I
LARPTDQPAEFSRIPLRERLVECDKFVLDRWRFDAPIECGGDGRFHILAVLQGQVRVEGDPTGESLRTGATLLLPASLGATPVRPEQPAVLLDAFLP